MGVIMDLFDICNAIHYLEPETEEGVVEETNSPMEVVLKEGQFNVSAIKGYEGEIPNKLEFRPQNFSQFIGQTEAKERAKTIIKRAKKGLKAHFLVDGIKGHGKTTFCELIARELDAHIIKRIGKQVNIDNLVDIINEINMSDKEHVMLFIDEIDTMDWKVIKILNPIIESFEISGKKIKPFIFASATINKHTLIKNNPDTLDRVATHIKFLRYNDKEISSIINQYIKQLYSCETVDADVVSEISKNCKFNPRTSIALLEDYVVEADIRRVLRNCNIVKDGLTKHDIRILQILNDATRPMGCNALAMKCGLNQNEYTREFEPFLVEHDYVNRVPSRVITEKGREMLSCLE